MPATILMYPRITQTTGGQDLPIDIFINRIRDGFWQDEVLTVRTIKDPDQRAAAKKRVPYVTVSGKFENRTDSGASELSGYIGMDVDDVDSEAVKAAILKDRYVYAAFTSISGGGVCIVFKINGAKHREAFAGLSEYLMENYGIICDPTGVNPSRARFISWDPGLIYNPDSTKFEIYPKVKDPKKIDPIIFIESDFTRMLADISSRTISICDNYSEWRNCGFALSEHFGEGGRDYFHVISAASAAYRPGSQAGNTRNIDRQYSACLKARGSGVTMATLYYYCKRAGIELYSERSRVIITAAKQAKKGKRTQEDTVANLEKFESIRPIDSAKVVQQVFEQDHVPDVSQDSELYEIEQFLRHNYDLRRNIITRRFENAGTPMEQKGLNTLFISAKKVFDKLNYDILERVINSDFTPSYNPLIEFFSANAHRKPSGQIDKILDTIATDDYEYTRYFCKKWFVGCIASIFGKVNQLMPVLSGRMHGTGKTQYFRQLLPTELKKYFAQTAAGMKDNDFSIMMTQKFIILDDEFEAKKKRDHDSFKSLLSREVFTVREPYGRHNVDLVRMANMCGTTQDESLLSDPTGNRRIIPVGVHNINHADYNRIDKTDVWAEAYNLYIEGFSYELTRKDIEMLNNQTVKFENYSIEYEMLYKYVSKPKTNWFEEMTTTEIKNRIESLTMQRLSRDLLGKELSRMEFQQVQRRVDGRSARLWQVVFNQPNSATAPGISTPPIPDSDGFQF